MRDVTLSASTRDAPRCAGALPEGGVTVEGIPAEDLVCEAAVLDVRAACAADPDYLLAPPTCSSTRPRTARCRARSAVLVCTGWGALRGDARRYVGDLRFPGVSAEAARLLVERGVAGIGIDTLSVDAGTSTDFAVHYTTLPAGSGTSKGSSTSSCCLRAARCSWSALRRWWRLGRTRAPARAAHRLATPKGRPSMHDLFRRFAQRTSAAVGSAWAFVAAVMAIVVWAATRARRRLLDTWQLVINTGTTIVTFLMVFLIQNTQNRDSKAIHLKLDELILSSSASNAALDLENLSDARAKELLSQFHELALRMSRERGESPAPEL